MKHLQLFVLVVALLMAPLAARAEPKKAAFSLAWTEWQLLSPSFPSLAKRPILKFSDTRLSASVGLNSLSGGYELSGTELKVEPMMSTMMGGPEELMNAEQQYAGALQGVTSFELNVKRARLTLRGTTKLVFLLTGTIPDNFVWETNKTLRVGPQLGPQMDGDKAPKYLQLEDLTPNVSWGKFTEEKIEGFRFVPGKEQTIDVQVERNRRTGEKRLHFVNMFPNPHLEPAKATGPRTLWVSIGGQDTQIAENVWKFWKVPSGLVYAGSDGAGGYENEGQSLWFLNTQNGEKRKVLAEVFAIENVQEVESKSGRKAYILLLRDGGLGAPHVAVADPKRGLVWRQSGAEVRAVRNGRLAVAVLPLGEIQGKAARWVYVDLDEVLKRAVIRAK